MVSFCWFVVISDKHILLFTVSLFIGFVGITEGQVKKWMANRRMRSGHTAPMRRGRLRRLVAASSGHMTPPVLQPHDYLATSSALAVANRFPFLSISGSLSHTTVRHQSALETEAAAAVPSSPAVSRTTASRSLAHAAQVCRHPRLHRSDVEHGAVMTSTPVRSAHNPDTVEGGDSSDTDME